MSRPLAFITGANKGIGKAVAESLASKHAYHVIIGSRNLDAGKQVASEIRERGHEASAVQLDLSSPSSIQSAIATIKKEFGYLDVLVNNAGILIDPFPSIELWDKYIQTFNTNVVGPGVLTEGLLPLLQDAKSRPPRIVFVTSAMGSLQLSTDKTTNWYPLDFKIYDASKAAVNMLMLNYARVLDGVGKVNAVCPGLVNTNLTGYDEKGHSPEKGALRIVEQAIIGVDGPSGTVSNLDGPLPW